MPSNTFICDSMTRMAVAEENPLITGNEIKSKTKPTILEKRTKKTTISNFDYQDLQETQQKIIL